MTSALEACRTDLFTDQEKLLQKYPDELAAKIMRIRTMHQWLLANPHASDAEAVRENVSRHQISRPTSYSDIRVLKQLVPLFSKSAKDFDRWRYIEMILETYRMAKGRGDTRTMERAATSYAKYTKIDEEEQSDVPVDMIVPQPFVATDDPSVLGIKRIPNIRERQRELLEKYLKESADIEDVDYEPADLDEQSLFGPIEPEQDEEQSIFQ